eukprot:188696-Pelagomonas_calceolata.AAC.4
MLSVRHCICSTAHPAHTRGSAAGAGCGHECRKRALAGHHSKEGPGGVPDSSEARDYCMSSPNLENSRQHLLAIFAFTYQNVIIPPPESSHYSTCPSNFEAECRENPSTLADLLVWKPFLHAHSLLYDIVFFPLMVPWLVGGCFDLLAFLEKVNQLEHDLRSA